MAQAECSAMNGLPGTFGSGHTSDITLVRRFSTSEAVFADIHNNEDEERDGMQCNATTVSRLCLLLKPVSRNLKQPEMQKHRLPTPWTTQTCHVRRMYFLPLATVNGVGIGPSGVTSYSRAVSSCSRVHASLPYCKFRPLRPLTTWLPSFAHGTDRYRWKQATRSNSTTPNPALSRDAPRPRV